MLRRYAFVLLSTGFSLGLMAYSFWRADWQYSLPTERPADLEQPAIGDRIDLREIGIVPEKGTPVFIHFFNPDCPCSRFNLDHVREIIHRHPRGVRFIAVLQGDRPATGLRKAFASLFLKMEAVVDESFELGKRTGVYATPQAVLLDGNGRLYYRGNYNLSRYCSDAATEYARIALDLLLAGKPAPAESPETSIAYGCPLRRKAADSKRGSSRR